MLKASIITISDRSSRGEREDKSGPLLAKEVKSLGWEVQSYEIIPDDENIISKKLVELSDIKKTDLILTTGGTGFAPRDVTPEATAKVINKSAPGLAELMRLESLKITPHAMLSRAIAGIRNSTLIINLPGSPKAARENFQTLVPLIPHAIELIKNDPLSEQHHNFDQSKTQI